MSNGTRQGGYDESLVVPLEASRRGAHRARVNPLVAALPLLAVVVVVAAVIGVAYTLFLKPSNTADTGTQSLPTVSPAPPTTTTPAGAGSSPSVSTSTSAGSSPSSSASATGTIDKTIRYSVANGSSPSVAGLGGKGLRVLQSAGWSRGALISGTWKGQPVTETTVFYAKVDQQASARAVLRVLGVSGMIKRSSSIAGQGLVVVVSNDFHS
jgi:LytR cell envelope-related transcriptional attenuator